MNKQLVVISPEDLKKTIEVAINNALLNEQKSTVPIPSKKVLVLNEAAAYIRMSVATFRYYLGKNEIRGYKIGKSWRFFAEDLDQFLKKFLRKTNAEIEMEIDEGLSK
ncbi:helix-turn-helix domain-containing protein [Ancylomarina sp.]|uniref:helix-turn-helix domain-containing protein n=1 Tax=Ancylomarina sp. TaxID=1970196 RepID=UPI0035691F93